MVAVPRINASSKKNCTYSSNSSSRRKFPDIRCANSFATIACGQVGYTKVAARVQLKVSRTMKRGSQQTYEVLKKRIIAGHYTAGTQLKENHIAEDIGVSRPPVRAALKKLIEDGLAARQSVGYGKSAYAREHTGGSGCIKNKNNILQRT